MSAFANYIKERENFDIIESEQGFASYKITDKECYIRDLWVNPDHRKSNIASNMANQIADIAKTKGCTHLIGTIQPSTNNSTVSLSVLLAYGFQLQSAFNDCIILKKDLV